MSQSIHIDLRNLTPEHLAASRPALGSCDYAGPCIIGSLLSEEQRELLAQWIVVRWEHGSLSDMTVISPWEFRYPEGAVEEKQVDIKYLLDEGAVTIPEDQVEDAVIIQELFDDGDWEGVLEIASRYMKEPAG